MKWTKPLNSYPLRSIGDGLSLALEQVKVEADTQYRIAGVRGFGNGAFSRDVINGNETSYKTLNRLRAGSIVMSRLKAFEGAIAFVPEELDGYYVSAEFPTFDVVKGEAEARYLKYICSWPNFWQMLQGESKGIGARRERVSAQRLLSIEVPLPGLDEQRRIADKLEVSLSRQSAALSAATERADVVFSTFDAMEAKLIDHGMASGWVRRPLGEVAAVNPRTQRPEGGEEVAFVPMTAVNSVTGEIDNPQRATASEIGSGYKMFRCGDVIFARITPCMQNGKSAIFQGGETEYGFGSTEFHVVRPGAAVDVRWIHRLMRMRRFREMAVPYMAGTAGQQRISAKYLQDVEIPVPSIERQHVALQKLDDLQRRRLKFRAMHRAQIDSLKALRSALLNAAFSGQL